MHPFVPIETIASRIILIRSHKVMLDRGLAELYEVETLTMKQDVRRSYTEFL
jgi:hypothetical protein